MPIDDLDAVAGCFRPGSAEIGEEDSRRADPKDRVPGDGEKISQGKVAAKLCLDLQKPPLPL
ncbi:hypothetical protein LJR007_003306 [Aminobacter sp. LjRoot7]